jgi:DNA-binding HxlR family transcriptional regulator
MKWENINEQVCSVARALSIVGERWTLLIIRDAFKGTRRFEGFHKNLGVTRHRLAERLAMLVDEGVLTKVPYSTHPERFEYRLTRKGLGLYPVLMTLSQWGDQWLSDEHGAPVKYWHSGCASDCHAVLACSECGEPLRAEEVSAKNGTELSDYVAHLKQHGLPMPTDAELPKLAGEYRKTKTKGTVR